LPRPCRFPRLSSFGIAAISSLVRQAVCVHMMSKRYNPWTLSSMVWLDRARRAARRRMGGGGACQFSRARASTNTPARAGLQKPYYAISLTRDQLLRIHNTYIYKARIK
jgi:hypothetical protein